MIIGEDFFITKRSQSRGKLLKTIRIRVQAHFKDLLSTIRTKIKVHVLTNKSEFLNVVCWAMMGMPMVSYRCQKREEFQMKQA